mgnify:CR=1 FL=1
MLSCIIFYNYKILQTSGGSNVSFNLLAGALGEVLNSNVYVLSSEGKVLGLHLNDIADSSVVEDDTTTLSAILLATSKPSLPSNSSNICSTASSSE